jgi:nitrate/nitrite transport system substrate-binding protein
LLRGGNGQSIEEIKFHGDQENETPTPRGMTRRDVVKQLASTASTAALVQAISLAFPGGVNIAHAAGPEVKKAVLGYIALMDASPLVIAKEKGIFAKYGMPDVEVSKQASWGATRDNLVLGSEKNGIDGAHILTPMPYLISAGKVTQNNVPTPMYILARLNLDAQCISVAKEYADLKVGIDVKSFKEALEKKKAAGKSIKAAMTFPGGTHDLWVRYWLAAGGIDPDKDIETITVPPPQMVANMKVGTMDCFCVGEPWPGQLVHQGIGTPQSTPAKLEQAPGEILRRAPPGSTSIRRPRRRSPWRFKRRSSGPTRPRTRKNSPPSWASGSGSTARSTTFSIAPRASSTTAPAEWSRTPRTS